MSKLLQRIKDLVESRTGLTDGLKARAAIAVPGGARWRYALGWMLVALVVVEVVTGLAMMTVYSPGTATAWASTHYLQHVLPWGGLVRSMHHWASHALVVMIGAHTLQVIVAKAHRAPREVLFWLGLALAGLIFGFAMTGFPLAWDQRGYWASRVETGIIGTMPGVGPVVQRAVLGGTQYGALTLTRFYTLHVAVLPALFAVLLGAHLALVRRHGLRGTEGSGDEATAWWPGQAARDMIAALVMVVLVVLIARAKGVVLDAPADPQSQYPARPEWYFSPLSQLLHHFQGPMQIVGTAVIPGLVTGYLAVLPFVDSDKRVGVARLAALAPLALFAAGAAFLGWELASHDRGDREFQKAQHAAQQERARALRLARRGISPDGPLDMMHNDPEVRPRALFAQHCGSCHAVRGVSTERKGPRLDGFGSRAWGAAFVAWPEHPELMGTSEIDDMQPMRRLSDDDLRAVGEWLHAQGVARGEPAADVALVERAVPIIRDRCNGCHLGSLAPADAEGAARDAPNLDGWGSREWIYEQIVNPHRLEQYGARNKMPRFRDKLSERELQMIVEYVRSLRTREAPTLIRPPRATPSAPAADGDAGTPTAP